MTDGEIFNAVQTLKTLKGDGSTQPGLLRTWYGAFPYFHRPVQRDAEYLRKEMTWQKDRFPNENMREWRILRRRRK